MRSDEMKQLHISCFPGDEEYAEYFFSRRFDPSHAYFAFEGETLAAAAYARIIELEIGERVIEVPFITGVATAPRFRMRGFARKVLSEAEEALREEGYPFMMLHPFNHDFYKKLGWVTINELGGFYPKPCGSPTKRAVALNADMWADTYRVYSEWAKRTPAHIFRSAEAQREHIEMFLKYCGTGYLIIDNGSPIAYVLIEEGEVVEAMSTTDDAYDGIAELAGKRIPLFTLGGREYSMAKLLDLKALIRLLPMRGVTLNARFGYSGKTYELKVDDGTLSALTEASGDAYEATPAEMLRTALGHGKEYPFSPIGSLFPEYVPNVFEKY